MLVVDGAGYLVDDGGGVLGVVVVVVGGAPRCTWGVGDLVDLVDEQQSPPFGRVGVELPGAGVAAGLVAEDHGSGGSPAEGVGADKARASVVGHEDRSASPQCFVEAGPGARGDRHGGGSSGHLEV
jgi:hypothetical protein